MSIKKTIIDAIIKREAGYVNDSSDSGGETNWGITIGVARTYGYMGDMVDLPKEKAFNIYSALYWDKVMADKMLSLSEAVTEEVVDTGVNCGTSRAVRFLQRSLNVLNLQGKHYADLTVDGQVGGLTLNALAHFLTTRNEDVLVSMLNALQGAFYVKLAERREKDEKFIYGWFLNRVVL
jgi:lysozyme family protein